MLASFFYTPMSQYDFMGKYEKRCNRIKQTIDLSKSRYINKYK